MKFHKKWEDEDWKNGIVYCPAELVAALVNCPPLQRLLGTVFGQTKITGEAPKHCPYEKEHQRFT
jgi:hypothetical protein